MNPTEGLYGIPQELIQFQVLRVPGLLNMFDSDCTQSLNSAIRGVECAMYFIIHKSEYFLSLIS